MAGTLAAVVLARSGHSVTLIDPHEIVPKQFRVEKIAGAQVDLMRKLQVFAPIAEASTPFSSIINARAGRIVDRTHSPHFGILYHDIVRVLRAQLPAAAALVIDKVVGIANGPRIQTLSLASGREVTADLIVLATGMSDALRYRLGIGRHLIVPRQSISFGFSLAPDQSQMRPLQALTYYGSGAGNQVDYLSLFPIGGGLRANLFTFVDHRDPWIARFRRDPVTELHAAMPGLASFLGTFRTTEPVNNWVMDLSIAENAVQDGVILIGDAFQTSCPAAGTGVTRLLTDIDRLCNVFIPRWLSSPGLGREKLSQFYGDEIKRNVDAMAMSASHFRRSLTVQPGIEWSLRRRHHFLRRRLIGGMGRLIPSIHPLKSREEEAT